MENSFDSVDRLLEFGMSMAVAQQMMQTMNNAMANMHVAGIDRKVQQVAAAYYVVSDGIQFGPFKEDEMSRLIEDGQLSEHTLVWKTGTQLWVEACKLPEINKLMMLRKLREQKQSPQ